MAVIENSYHNNTEVIDGVRYTTRDVSVNNKTSEDGQSYTSAISNDQLTNDDFLKLMLEEMKMQDPTKPMDSSALMDSQLKMSTIDTNQQMMTSMESLANAYSSSSLANAVGLMGQIIENGEVYQEEGADGVLKDTNFAKSYKVKTIETIDGEVYVNANELTGFQHSIAMYGEEDENGLKAYISLDYDTNGNIKDEDGNATNVNVIITDNGQFETNSAGNVNLYDENNDIVIDDEVLSKYLISPPSVVYSDEITQIPVISLTKITNG